MKGKNFFWFAAGIAILLVAAYGVFSDRINEVSVNPKSGDFRIIMSPSTLATKPTVTSQSADDEDFLGINVPGLGPIDLGPDGVFLISPGKDNAMLRNVDVIERAVVDGRSDVRVDHKESDGTFSVWVKYVDFNEQSQRCVHYTTLYRRYSGDNEWGMWRACQTKEGWVTNVDPDFLELLTP